MDLSIIIPCYNEDENLEVLVNRINSVFKENRIYGEIILINDCSTDNTQYVIEKLQKEFSNVIGKRHEKNLGMASGWKTGLKACKSNYILTMDADLQYLPEDIPKLYFEIKENNSDLVQGWRIAHEKNNKIRYVLSWSLSSLLNFLFSMHLKDNKSGFIICKKNVFQDILDYKYNYFFFQQLITVSANSKGYKIKQTPIKFAKRYKGKSYIKDIPFLFIIKTMSDLAKAFIEFRLRG